MGRHSLPDPGPEGANRPGNRMNFAGVPKRNDPGDRTTPKHESKVTQSHELNDGGPKSAMDLNEGTVWRIGDDIDRCYGEHSIARGWFERMQRATTPNEIHTLAVARRALRWCRCVSLEKMKLAMRGRISARKRDPLNTP